MRRLLRADLGLGRDIALLFWSTAAWGGGFSLFYVLIALWAERLDASPGQIGLVLGAPAFARALLSLPAGALADRFSAKPVMVWCFAISIPGALVVAAAGTWWHALIGAVIIDISAVSVPATSAYIAAVAGEDNRTRAYTYVYNISFAASGILAPALGGWLADAAGFRVVFVLAAALFAIGTVALTRIGDPGVPAGAGENAPGRSPASPAGYRQVLALRGVLIVAALFFCVPMVLSLGTALLPNFLEDERGLRVGTIGTLGSLSSAASLVFSLVVAHNRRLSSPFLGIALCVAAVGASFGLLLSSDALAIVALAFVLRGAYSVVWPLLAAAVADVTPEQMRGRAYGFTELTVGIADVASPVAAGQLYGLNPRLPLVAGFVSALPIAAATLLVYRLRDRLAPRVAEAQPGEREPAASA
jgi:MFS family permease